MFIPFPAALPSSAPPIAVNGRRAACQAIQSADLVEFYTKLLLPICQRGGFFMSNIHN